MKSYTEPLFSETFYHVYNRGINGEQLFKEERNYNYFLQKYGQYLSGVVDTYAYCLMGNHFHFLIRTKSEEEILEFGRGEEKVGTLRRDADLKTASWYISKQFATFFKSYSLSINKAYGRTGGLFEEPFRRLEVKSDRHFSQLVYYIHANPQKHGFCDDFRDYAHSSYWSHLSEAASKLKRKAVLTWFGDAAWYTQFHAMQNDLGEIDDLVIEFD